eukprot:CAMPEP_0177603174 /NCGR_PEP_ID=MMETSP0419_2-20121207/15346_1 /TAXON_ID=582737 /ORGANISM="Tetraselmis sp., Strain GSL018" /LENGTH=211 /DNA_ID=CAMNT_0019096877 /DNA_START=129 /DNA_END=764 /DNA_ORIENTATION=-
MLSSTLSANVAVRPTLLKRAGVSSRAPCPAAARIVAPVRQSAPVSRATVVVRAAYQEEAQAMRREWPNPAFVKETLEAFPEKGVCDVEEGLVLFKNGYVWLDIRSSLNRDSVGHVKGSVHVPWTIEKKRFVDGQMVVDTEDNPKFLAELRKKIPDKNTHIMVADIDGKTNAIDCLETMFDEGYENIVGIKGGFKAWFRTFDNKLRRRVFGQ